MKYLLSLSAVFIISMSYTHIGGIGNGDMPRQSKVEINEKGMLEQQLRHVVLIKFKESASSEDIATVEEAFSALPDKISQISDYEWGTNNSPEGLNKGFTHCFFVTFESEEDRAVYLPHPDHKAFVEVLKPHLEDVLVVDYWAKE